jgi:asparagine synthase (glutamine-hydrolysing)
MENIVLEFNNGFKWFSHGRIMFKGYIFRDQEYLREMEALEYFSDIVDENVLIQRLKSLDGFFSVVIDLPGKIIIASDRLSFFPLFYHHSTDGWKVSDNWYTLIRHKKQVLLNYDAFGEFLSAGFVLSNETLEKEIEKTTAASVVILEKSGINRSFIWSDFLPTEVFSGDFLKLQQGLLKEIEIVSRKLISSLEGRTAVVPLSGGYDSRLIACMLKKAGYQKVVCITYGRPSYETEISEKVANALGYKWHFIDYSELDYHGYLDDEVFQDYYKYAGRGFSMPYLQEFFAAGELLGKGLIPRDSVYIPGHSGDWLAGSYILKTIRTNVSRSRLAAHIRDLYFVFAPLRKRQREILKSRIEKSLVFSSKDHISHQGFNELIENWDAREKLPKFIFNSSHVFPFFGQQVRFPLWDKVLIDFFRKAPMHTREGKRLYNTVVEQYFFAPLGVDFQEAKVKLVSPGMQRFKNRLRDMLPSNYFRIKLKKSDVIFYDGLTWEMEKELKRRGRRQLKRFYSYNARICRWYLYTIETLKADE